MTTARLGREGKEKNLACTDSISRLTVLGWYCVKGTKGRNGLGQLMGAKHRFVSLQVRQRRVRDGKVEETKI